MNAIPTVLKAHPRSSFFCVLVAAAGLLTGAPVQGASAVDQGKEMQVDAKVLEALAAIDALDAAILGQDAEAFANILAPEIVVNSPGNQAILRPQILQNFSEGSIKYNSYVRDIEYAEPHGADVIVMGWETVEPIGNSPGAGTKARRRFTDVWTPRDGGFKLRARQATVVSAE